MLEAKLGISPIAWWNDDLPELSDDVSLEECMRQARAAGFTGMELGRRFPVEADVLRPILAAEGMALCGGWFSGHVLLGDLEAEKAKIAPMIALFKAIGAPAIAYGELARATQGDRSAPLADKAVLSDDEMRTYGRNMTAFAEWCAEEGVPLTYHHHMTQVVETEAELDSFMNHTGEALKLLYDCGHMAFAGGDVLATIDKHHARIGHVHMKDVRFAVRDRLDRNRESFLDAVVKGVFTVPGDGSLDMAAIAQRLADHGYQGWFVVEAEQDPVANPPQKMAALGRDTLTAVLSAAGYQVAITA